MKVIIILLIVIILFLSFIESFSNFDTPNIFNYPWWQSTRNTRNMIYDIRGSPVIIPHQEFIWNNNDQYNLI
jgi:hypothetical protein